MSDNDDEDVLPPDPLAALAKFTWFFASEPVAFRVNP